MTDSADPSGQQAVAEPRAGQRLANARRANNISMRDIAKELHLDEVKVQALEDNRFEVLGAPVFAKGYLRKYAELVNVPIDDVLADYYRLNRAVGAPPVVGPRRRKPAADFSPGPWILTAIVLLIMAATAYWWLNREPLPSGVTPLAAPLAAVPAEIRSGTFSAGPGQAPAPDPAPSAGDDSVEPGAAVADDASYDVASAAPPSAAASIRELQLQLRYSGDCWTEVTDGNGRRLFFGLGTGGRNINVSGVPPLRVLLGNNDNVSLMVDGVGYTVPASEVRGNTARLTIIGS